MERGAFWVVLTSLAPGSILELREICKEKIKYWSKWFPKHLDKVGLCINTHVFSHMHTIHTTEHIYLILCHVLQCLNYARRNSLFWYVCVSRISKSYLRKWCRITLLTTNIFVKYSLNLLFFSRYWGLKKTLWVHLLWLCTWVWKGDQGFGWFYSWTSFYNQSISDYSLLFPAATVSLFICLQIPRELWGTGK